MAHNQTSYINKIKLIYPNIDYTKTIYTSMDNDIEIYCTIHKKYFFINAYKHMYKNKSCTSCKLKSGRKNINHEYAINKIKDKHGDKYDLSNINMITSSSDILNIKCQKHGFFDIMVSRLIDGRGCPNCCQGSLQSYIDKFNVIHNNKYSYIEVNKSKVTFKCDQKHITCIPIRNHFNGVGCTECKNIEFRKKYLKLLTDKHNNKYSYDLSNATKTNDKIDITCKLHGVFTQAISNHYYGQGCPNCTLKSYNNEKFVELCNEKNNGLGRFYIIKCFNDTEIFYKIGITSRKINERYSYKKEMPYNYEILIDFVGDASTIFNFELIFKNYIKKHKIKYQPLIKFNGAKTECYKFGV